MTIRTNRRVSLTNRRGSDSIVSIGGLYSSNRRERDIYNATPKPMIPTIPTIPTIPEAT